MHIDDPASLADITKLAPSEPTSPASPVASPSQREAKTRGPITKPFRPAVLFVRGQRYDLGGGLVRAKIPQDLQDHRTPKKEEKLYACLHHGCHEIFKKWSMAVAHMKTCAEGDGKRGAIDQCYLKAHAVLYAQRRLERLAEGDPLSDSSCDEESTPKPQGKAEAKPRRDAFRRGSTYDLGDGLRGMVPKDLPDLRQCGKADQVFACGHTGCCEVFKKWSSVQGHMRACDKRGGQAGAGSRQQCFMKAYAVYDAKGVAHKWADPARQEEEQWERASAAASGCGVDRQGSLWGSRAWDTLGWPEHDPSCPPGLRVDPRRWTEIAPETRGSTTWVHLNGIPKHQSAQWQDSTVWSDAASRRESVPCSAPRGSLWGGQVVWADDVESATWPTHDAQMAANKRASMCMSLGIRTESQYSHRRPSMR